VRDTRGGFPGDESLYAVLQVSPWACPEVIQAAYRVLARIYHPDVSTAADAEWRTRQLNAAYDVLSDPGKRADYDASLPERTRRNAPGRWPQPTGHSTRTTANEPVRRYERPMGPVLVAWIVTALVATAIVAALVVMLWSLSDSLDAPGAQTMTSGKGSGAPLPAPLTVPGRITNGSQPH
jgi:hypothetical protein